MHNGLGEHASPDRFALSPAVERQLSTVLAEAPAQGTFVRVTRPRTPLSQVRSYPAFRSAKNDVELPRRTSNNRVSWSFVSAIAFVKSSTDSTR